MTSRRPDPSSPPLELWGGLECTVARVGDRYRDQLRETGHCARPDDLQRVASLGIRTLRYPVLWETVSPEPLRRPDWRFHDERLPALRALGIRPIVGLIHHGSGPPGTGLLDPAFPRLLAAHAGRVARRYPWVADYTPVNEPLTTARFACLYGHWYPHAHSERELLTAVVHQCLATVLSMRAIRRVNSEARLIQTDDLGRVFSTPALAYQEDYENERRWLTFDLLFGRVDRRHPFWPVLLEHGISERQLNVFLAGDVRPDIVGINHYLTSDRYLDERTYLYPEHLIGGNAFTRYSDVEAVRVDLPTVELGPAARLRETWARYRSPMAVTEAHHGCTRDEQLRWLHEVWRAAETVRGEGADMRAVAVWSLFGTVDWNTLLTREDGVYEPGAYDVRGPRPRPTALAHATQALAETGRFDHPVLDVPGWWRRDDHRYGRVLGDARAFSRPEPRAILIAGPDSPVRRAFARLAIVRGLAFRIIDGEPRQDEVAEIADERIWAVLDLTGFTASEGVAREGGRHHEAARLAAWCGRTARPFVTLAAGSVFGRDPPGPRREGDATAPTDVAAREASLVRAAPGALVIRTGPLFGPWEPDDILAPLLAALAGGRAVTAGRDIVSPTYLPDLVHVALDLLVDGEVGIWHLANPEVLPAVMVARGLADRLGRSRTLVRPGLSRTIVPALATDRGQLMPPLDSALDRYIRDQAFLLRGDAPLLIAAE